MVLQEFKKPEEISARSKESQKWFLDKVKSTAGQTANRNYLIRRGKATPTPQPGMMYMFRYDPKTKDTLPFYDKFPLIILVDIGDGGFEGINLHYLPIGLRQRFFYGGLLNTASDKRFNENTFFKISYDILKGTRSMKAFAPCFKKYLTPRVRGSIVHVPSNEWEMAIHLPSADFAKKEESIVHQKSKEQIGRF